MSAVRVAAAGGDRDGLAPALKAVRARLGLVVLLLALGGVAWWSTAERMSGMDEGPGTPLGALGWFLGVWVVMMAAMMFPSVAPTVALYARMANRRWPLAPLVFTAGYVVTWAAAGVVAYALFELVRHALGSQLAWDSAGRWVAGGTLVLAAAYELTPAKDACLGRCRSPLGALLGSWRDGTAGALRMGTRNGAWCVGCCWALMASLFALGVMSVAWMSLVAGLITLEKLLPWRRIATYGTAVVLLALGLLLLTAPHVLGWLTTPTSTPMM